MTALADTPLAPLDPVPTDAPTARAGGSKPLAAALLAAPLLLAGGVAVHPDDTQGVEKTLAAIGGDSSTLWAVVHLLEPFAWALLGITLMLALPRMAGARGGTLLKVAGVLSAIGWTSLALIVYAHGETFRFMADTVAAGTADPSVYGPLFESFEQAMPLAAMPSLAGQLGLLLAAAGLVRARTVPLWAAPLLLSPIVLMGNISGLPLAVGLAAFFGPLLVTLTMVARRVARTGGPALG